MWQEAICLTEGVRHKMVELFENLDDAEAHSEQCKQKVCSECSGPESSDH